MPEKLTINDMERIKASVTAHRDMIASLPQVERWSIDENGALCEHRSPVVHSGSLRNVYGLLRVWFGDDRTTEESSAVARPKLSAESREYIRIAVNDMYTGITAAKILDELDLVLKEIGE